MSLLQLQAESAAVESSGQATAEARARADAAKIEALAAVKQAELKAEAAKIEFEAEQTQLAMKRMVDLKHRREQNALEVAKAEEEAAIETEKFKQVVSAITPETIAKIATAGPEAQEDAAPDVDALLRQMANGGDERAAAAAARLARRRVVEHDVVEWIAGAEAASDAQRALRGGQRGIVRNVDGAQLVVGFGGEAGDVVVELAQVRKARLDAMNQRGARVRLADGYEQHSDAAQRAPPAASHLTCLASNRRRTPWTGADSRRPRTAHHLRR